MKNHEVKNYQANEEQRYQKGKGQKESKEMWENLEHSEAVRERENKRCIGNERMMSQYWATENGEMEDRGRQDSIGAERRRA